MIDKIQTEILEVAYLSGGKEDGDPVLLLHGWPDDATGWLGITTALEAGGFRWVAPWLRGFGGTRFLNPEAIHDGTGVAIAQDGFDLANALGWDRFSVVGHDWGGRAAYIMAALAPERIKSITSLAIGYAPGGQFTVPSFPQSHRWWYQWFMATPGGADAVRNDPEGFARYQWQTWSPEGWFNDREFARTAESFRNPDWADVTLNAYRSRWQQVPIDPHYDGQRAIVAQILQLKVPTLMVQGGDDRCDPPSESETDFEYFDAPYRREVLDGVGHFPSREAPETVSGLVTEHLAAFA